jgi:dihydroxyacetone kinase DhaKLM complex PTS-EIIA-like component DhaM
MTGETEGPVARIESIIMLLSIAAYENLAIFKVDIGSAFMRTPMVDDVKHKGVRLDKLVAKILQEL